MHLAVLSSPMSKTLSQAAYIAIETKLRDELEQAAKALHECSPGDPDKAIKRQRYLIALRAFGAFVLYGDSPEIGVTGYGQR